MMLLDNAVRADKSGRERQGRIDAMRGFAIFLVVVGISRCSCWSRPRCPFWCESSICFS